MDRGAPRCPPADCADEVDLELIEAWLQRAGFPPAARVDGDVLSVPLRGPHPTFRLHLQLFADEKVLFLQVNDYLRVDEAETTGAIVMLLTQIATINYELLLGKLQLNPRTGEISLSAELQLDDGLGFRTFAAVTDHLARTAAARHPELLQVARGGAF